MDERGNVYAMAKSCEGAPTFVHIKTQQRLHGRMGPWVEAWQLYIQTSGLLTRQGPVVVYDAGLGCGTLLLAAWQAFQENDGISEMTVISFDLEKQGLAIALQNIEQFSFAIPHHGD